MKYIDESSIKKSQGKKTVNLEESFFQVPKSLFRNEKYRKLTPASKIVYMELLDRVGLSIVNGMRDESGRYYVKMSREKANEVLGLSFKTFERAKENLAEFNLLEVKEINKRTHHLYVFLPEKLETECIQVEEDSSYPDIEEEETKGEGDKMMFDVVNKKEGFGERVIIGAPGVDVKVFTLKKQEPKVIEFVEKARKQNAEVRSQRNDSALIDMNSLLGGN